MSTTAPSQEVWERASAINHARELARGGLQEIAEAMFPYLPCPEQEQVVEQVIQRLGGDPTMAMYDLASCMDLLDELGPEPL